ncbi:MAG: ribokinase [Candidatus Nanopelagicales bacterium]
MSLVVVVGSLNDDVVVSLDRLPLPGETVLGRELHRHAGGKGLNQAVAAARLGSTVCLVGAVGDDDAGRRLASVLHDEGVGDRLRLADGSPSGTALIEVDTTGENRIVVVPGANAALTDADVTTAAAGLGTPAVVLTQAEIPLAAAYAAMIWGRSCGAVTIFNPSPVGPLPDGFLHAVDVLVANEHEAASIAGVSITSGDDALRAARQLLGLGPRTVVVTRGSEGSVWSSATEGDGTQPAYAVTALDAVGAGDAFCGTLAAQLAHGETTADAVRWASAAGALATTRSGAVPSLPDRDSVERLVRDGS